MSPDSVRHVDYLMEIYYSVDITPTIALRPNTQFIHALGGVDDRANVLLLGLHWSVRF